MSMYDNKLVGYARTSKDGGDIKISINVDSIKDCDTAKTSDGKTWIPLVISRYQLEKVIRGENTVTTIFQRQE